ncbi:aspartic peptidase domain-containing protein [Crucibulum laeve]|uniref:Aspartic peptidase domain-containing protein n=1 Tax=Crucibulum laeve TaxID=68775 RepID=A0A5C3M4P3_9AGAR|nr:aspartic peptidase domain-containing protein [Crucibulum laeve]
MHSLSIAQFASVVASVLIWGVVLAISHPLPQSEFISIPIVRIHTPAMTLSYHPSIIHQQHVNRGIRRLAHMTGRAQPSYERLWSNIRERIDNLYDNLQPRYNHASLEILKHMLSSANTRKTNRLQMLSAASVSATSGDSDLESLSNSLMNAASAGFVNTIGLDIQSNDVGYLATVKIGTPPRNFRVLVDSGSADLWVGGEGCRNNGKGCGNHTRLGPHTSTTFNDTMEQWSITYGTGAVSGHLVQDDITIAGLKYSRLKFGVARNASDEFTSNTIPFDGLLGFAKSTISQQQTPTLLESLHKVGLIKNAIASYKIPRLADGKDDGELTLGATNPAKFNASTFVTVENVNKMGFWEAAIDSVSVNGISLGWSNRTAILDTGTTLLIAPQEDVDTIHQAIPGANFDGSGWTVPCKMSTSLALTFKGQEFPIDPRDIAFLPLDEDNPEMCMSGISAGNVGFFGQTTEWLVGDVFLKNVYFSTNANEDRDEISFAHLAD